MQENSDTALEQNVEENDQETVTLGEVLQSEEELMDDVNAVLGAIDDKKCTYSEGYMKRQALYSCLTCIPEARKDISKCAGICLACCYNCHEGHELIELYTKRSFRCDCGNDKFPNLTCNLDNAKDNLNELNRYNQNFTGVYCTCRRPYPDPEDTVTDEMIQCIICEDWFHTRHLGVPIPSQNVFAEMCCEACIKEHQFLLNYHGLSVTNATSAEVSESEATNIDIVNNSTEQESIENCKQVCSKPKTKSDQITSKFWTDIDWRSHLCTCPECIQLYEEQKVIFLIDPQDTVHVYEEKGKERAREFQTKQDEAGIQYLNSLNRVPLMEAIAGYNDLKANLTEYLKKFAENKKVVREEDIKEFFSKFDTKKKLKADIPHFCR